MPSLVEQVRDAGVVGAGGAGFPTHLKYNTQVEVLLANGAECEPLLYKDKELMRQFPDEVHKGMKLAADTVGASRRILGIKAKAQDQIGQFRRIFGGTGIEIFEMGDHYPAGDEYVLVYEATGRLIPYGGYPVDIGCVVSNVETLLNVALASIGVPVTEKFITVAGAVNNPVTLKVPIGTSISDVIALAGGPSISGEIAVLDGGAMMGARVPSFENPVTKLSGGYIVLPVDHYLIRKRSLAISEIKRIGQSACDQCSYCTEYCPRYLLGYDIQPHKVMRSLGFAGEKEDYWGKFAVNCSECNLCSLYACPEELDPRQACVRSKTNIGLKNIEYTPPNRPLAAHPMQAHRKVLTKKLTRKLGLAQYDTPAVWTDDTVHPERVIIPLKQHLGTSSVPTVGPGDNVTVGQLIAQIADSSVGANIHASINGRVVDVNEAITIEA
ncbi:MAG: SLBB domain-containing protein [candidate division Zixibacteria bacterium]|nr:SLBB domain-containing protein [candidate division Zixibacteria bacterium]